MANYNINSASLWYPDALPPVWTLVTWKQVWFLLHASLTWGGASSSVGGGRGTPSTCPLPAQGVVLWTEQPHPHECLWGPRAVPPSTVSSPGTGSARSQW